MKPLVAANWKMNPKTLREAKKLLGAIKTNNKVETLVCPPSVFLSSLSSKKIKLGAQNCYFEEKGAFTGENSVLQIKSLGAKYIISGHSERRGYFGETDEEVNKKLKAILKEGISPILCIGETEKQRKEGNTEKVLQKQLKADLDGISSAKFSKIVVAYEPIWAIGTGNACEAEEAQKMRILIKKILGEIYNKKVAQKTRVLYGGSVKSHNAEKYVKEAGFEGLLVGGASLKAIEFSKIIKAVI